MKVIMLDGFKPEYLQYAPYIKSLTEKNQWGELEMPLGFWGGVETFFKGKSEMLAFFYRTEKSSFRWIKYFIFLGRFPAEVLLNLYRLASGRKLFRINHFPLKKLPYLDTEVKMSFEKKFPIDYEYIGDADFTAHKFGTKSNELIECVKNIDKMLEGKKFDIIFSDHGMKDISKIISVPETDDCLIESTMARYWGKRPDFKSKFGRWIKGNGKYGNHIFLANPGVLILPNYWQGNNEVRAMHGYDGKDKDMKAMYILNKSGNKKNLKVEELNKIFVEMLNGK